MRGIVSGRASAIRLPSAPASRSKLPRWRWRMRLATRSRPPTGAAICSTSAGNWAKPGRGIVHDPSRTVRSVPYLPQRGQFDEPDAIDALRDDDGASHRLPITRLCIAHTFHVWILAAHKSAPVSFSLGTERNSAMRRDDLEPGPVTAVTRLLGIETIL